MKLVIRNFGATADIIGQKSLEVELPNAATIEDLEAYLFETYPSLKDLASLLIAVNEEYGESGLQLDERDTIALIPPVSGG